MRMFKTMAVGLSALSLAVSGAAQAAATRASDAVLTTGARAEQVDFSRGSGPVANAQELGGTPFILILLALLAVALGIYFGTKSDSNG
jgi:hypothetical protein